MSYLAEQNVIGSLLLDKNCIDKICNVIEPQMFSSELLGSIYNEFLRGYENHYDVNAVALIEKLHSDNMPENIIAETIKECSMNTITSASIKLYADMVLNAYKVREAEKIINNIKLSSFSVNEQIGTIINELEALQSNKKTEEKTLSDITKEYKDNYFKEDETQKNYIGFSKLDDIIGGLEGGDVIIIGARPGVGKSALVTQISSNIANLGKRVGFYNLEMKNKQMYERFVSAESGIGLTRIRRAKQFLGDEKERFERANEVLAKRSNIFIATGSKTVSEIRSESRHMNYDIIIIDYLQLLKTDVTYRGNRYAEVGAISKAIKALAMELNIPVILLSQLNRVSEIKETKEPTMAELRESGDIEQDASVIILLWNLTEDRIKKGCKVEKNRQGITGRAVMEFNGNLMKFVETNEDIKKASEWREADFSTPFD